MPEWKTGLDVRNLNGVDIALPGWMKGAAIGGALGASVQFNSAADIQKRYGEHGPMQFSDVFGKPGAITSDTQLMLLSMDAMVRAHVRATWFERTDPVNEVKLGLRRWLVMEQDGWFPRANELFERRWADRATVDAIRHYMDDGTFGTFGNPLNNSQGSSVLSRAGVAALWSSDMAEVFDIGARIAALTHGHPNAYLAAGAYAVIVHYCLRVRNLVRAIDAARTYLTRWKGHEEVHDTLSRVVDAQFSADAKLDPATIESFGDSTTALGALAIAARAAISDHRFEYVVGRAITINGDSAATGALAGALYGVSGGGNHLPEDLVAQVELSERMSTLAYQVRREFSEEPMYSDEFYSWFPFSQKR
ncbi:ADP-ribosylglycohydrolase family protein [Kibdelosporangium philippinense]|uniref:ADP-ribosylglycohydrolase family protein n=1 Tax=Kibdelosporangium philippinense TaxID=211113 RepID=A0ABS8ZCZ6_9PSEU|nr:ADP-ribosylglycohydrolase family protein [Kibdelosporangium philippinense]MCE7005715.1 ADP-ribosylglycohydrolase family protein [Kibdelosporangium philippinense]